MAFFIFRAWHNTAGERYLDWRELGICASELSADLTEVTLRVRNQNLVAELSRAVLKAASQGGR